MTVNAGDEEWATYDVLLDGGIEDAGGHLGTHTVSSIKYQLHWQAICSTDFDDLDGDVYQQHERPLGDDPRGLLDADARARRGTCSAPRHRRVRSR